MKVENNILMKQFVILSGERAKLFVSQIRHRSHKAENNIQMIEFQIPSKQHLNYPISKSFQIKFAF